MKCSWCSVYWLGRRLKTARKNGTPVAGSENVEHLFLYLLEFIFHLHNENLHVGLI